MRKQKGCLLQQTMAILLSAVLVAGILAGAVPVNVLAQENIETEDAVNAEEESTGDQTEETPQEEVYAAEDEIASGTDWVLDSEGTLTISSDQGMVDWIAERENYSDTQLLQVTEVVIADGVTYIERMAFLGCICLVKVTIPDSVTTIGNSAFNSCDHLTEVTIPNSVTSIGMQAFDCCLRLTGVTIPDSVTTIGAFAFNSCVKLTEITIPDSVTSIEQAAFIECSGLTEITIPDSVSYIGHQVFGECRGLTQVTMQGSTPPAIGSYVFRGCKFVMDDIEGVGINVPAGTSDAYKTAWAEWERYIAAEHTHSYGDWESDSTNHWRECSCGATGDMAAHTEDDGTVTTPPTQTETGIRTYKCTVCGYVMRTEQIPATGSDGDDNSGGGSGGSGNAGSDDNNSNDSSSDSDDSGSANAGSNNDSKNNIAGSNDNGDTPDNNRQSDPVTGKEPKTGDNAPLELYATLAMISGLAYLLLYFTERRHGMTEETKKELVSGIVGWVKRGGKLRRLPALVAIFVLLVYYHSIGKKTAMEWMEVYGKCI